MLRSTFLLTPTDVRIRFQYIAQFIRQIVLASHNASVDGDAGSDRRRRDGKDSEDHPIGASIFF
jgi:hypothetical protein